MINEKPNRRWCVANGIDERGERIDAFPTISPPSRKDEGHDGVGLICTRQVLRKRKMKKVGTQKRRKTAIYYGKVCKRLRKRADDDRTDWTMQTTTGNLIYFASHSETMR